MPVTWQDGESQSDVRPKAQDTPTNAQWQERPKSWSGMTRSEASEETLRSIEGDPDKAREAFAKIKSRQNRSFAARVNEVSGPVGRGAVRGAEGVGRFAVNSFMRGMSYLPGLEEWSDKADHLNRLAAIQEAYDQYEDETGLTSKFIGADGAKFAGALGETVSQSLLLSGAGRAVGAAKSPMGMTKFMAASYGAMDAERSLTVAKDAGLKGWRKNAYATGMGALSGALTYGFGLAGEKMGGMSAEELLSRGAGRSLSSLMLRSGIKRELLDMALEGGEEESIAFSQAVLGNAFGMDKFDAYKQNFGKAFVGGATTRGLFGAARRLQNKLTKTVDDIPKTAEAFTDAQNLAETTDILKAKESEARLKAQMATAENDEQRAAIQEQLDEVGESVNLPPEIKEKMVDPAYAASMNAELDFQAGMRNQARKDVLPIEEARASLETRKRALASKSKAMAGAEMDEETTKAATESLGLEQTAIEEAEAGIKEQEEKLKAESSGNDLRKARAADDMMKGQDDAATAQDLQEVVSVQRAYLKRDADFFGFDRAPIAERQKWADTLEEVRNEGLHLKAMEIAQRSLTTGEIWNRKTKFAVGEGYRIKLLEYMENKRVLDTAPEDSDVDSFLARDKRLRDDVMFLNEALDRNQSEAGDSFNGSKLVVRLGGDIQKSLRRAKRSKGAELTEGENKKIFEAGAKIDQLEKKLDDGKLKSEDAKDLSDSIKSVKQSLGEDQAEERGEPSTSDPAERTKKVLTDVEKIKNTIERLRKFDPTDPVSDVAKDELDTLLAKASRVYKDQNSTPQDRDAMFRALESLEVLATKMGGLKPGTKEYDTTQRDLWVARRELESAEFTPQSRTFGARLSQYNKLWHEIVLAGDLSGMGIQGGLLAVMHPIKYAETIVRGFKGGMTSETELDLLYSLHSSPNGDLYRAGAVSLMDPDAPLLSGEDAGFRGFKDIITKKFGDSKVGKLVQTLPRIYRSTVNSMRAGTFDMLVDSMGGRANLTQPELMAVGSFVDAITGRGGRGYLDKAVNGLGFVALAPRNYASKLELLAGWHYWQKGQSPKVKSMIAKEYARLFGSWLAVYATAMVGNFFSNLTGAGDVSKVELNPFEKRFMQIKIGNTWIDPSMKLAAYIGTGARAARAIKNNRSEAKLHKSDGSLYDADAVQNFFRGKSSFPVGTFTDTVVGKDMGGRPTTLTNLAVNRLTPITPREIIRAGVENGLSENMMDAFFETTGFQFDYDKKSKK